MKDLQKMVTDVVAEHCEFSEREIQTARKFFPRGLLQPKDSFRFSGDALLLAEFAADLTLPADATVADLGAGCGVVGLGILLRRSDMPGWRVVGIEKFPALVEAVRINACRLGLAGCTAFAGDIERRETLTYARQLLVQPNPHLPADDATGNAIGAAAANAENLPLFDAVVCNPPWLREGTGRVPPSSVRRAALFGDATTFPLFFNAADKLLKLHGSLAVVCGAERLTDVLTALPSRLRPVRLRFLHPAPAAPATFFLLEARKGSGASLAVEPPCLSVPLKNVYDAGDVIVR